MILNIIVIVFLLAMAYWASTQGLFSALLHLAMTIAAGAIALAIWEPLTQAFLLGFKPPIAWGVGLVLPFALILLLLRLAADKLVPKNVNVMHLLDLLGGGAAGAISGVLTAGITLIGVGFLPFGSSVAGYQPYAVSAYGQVEPAGGLWVPVDHWTTRFYEYVAGGPGWFGGAFTTGGPLAHRVPDVAKQASLVRLRPKFASVAATDEAVSIPDEGVYRREWDQISGPAKEPLEPGVTAYDASKLVVVDTKWQMASGVYDPDRNVRVSPTQVRLLAKTGAGDVETFGPIAVSRQMSAEDTRYLIPFEDADAIAYGENQNESFAWVFALPEQATAQHVLIRRLRFALPESDAMIDDADAVRGVLGELPPEPEQSEGEDASDDEAQTATDGESTPPDVPWIVATDLVPGPAAETNQLQGIGHDDNHAFTEGEQTFTINRGDRPNYEMRVDRIKHATVRLEMPKQRKDSLLGSALASAAGLKTIRLIDNAGNEIFPHAYVHMQDGKKTVHVNALMDPFRRSADLPDLTGDETLYLYFNVRPGRQLVEFRYGRDKSQDLKNWRVPEPDS